ncbi:MAG: omptin family outer membrane protease [Gammaproteobacteria bacterium]|nr:omptin family outer membrane protease [Gammaproteobacteria bacterium]
MITYKYYIFVAYHILLSIAGVLSMSFFMVSPVIADDAVNAAPLITTPTPSITSAPSTRSETAPGSAPEQIIEPTPLPAVESLPAPATGSAATSNVKPSLSNGSIVARASPFIILSLGQKAGETIYQIGGWVETSNPKDIGMSRFPFSELRYPLNVPIMRLDFEFPLGDKFLLAGGFEKNITRNAGIMKDSDWLASPVVPDIYSESDTAADIKEFQVELAMRLKGKRIIDELKLKVGLLWQEYEFKMSNTLQSYPTLGLPEDFTPGETLGYRIKTIAPYIGLAFTKNVRSKLDVELQLDTAPFISIQDVDKHLSRNIVSHSSSAGHLFRGQLGLLYRINDSLGVFAKVKAQTGDATGREHQDHYDPASPITWAEVDIKHTYSQLNGYAGVGYRF